MDQITFSSDTVLSDVHLLLPNASHLMVRLNQAGQAVFTSHFRILRAADSPVSLKFGEGENSDTCRVIKDSKDKEEGEQKEVLLDEDGDLEVTRKPHSFCQSEGERQRIYPTILSKAEVDLEDEGQKNEEVECAGDIIRIEHTMATPLEDVGKQVWRGAFLLADFIFAHPQLFSGATVLELGAGTGLTSIVMATAAKRVFCTDIGHDLLDMCRKNVVVNRHLLEAEGGEVRVRELDWLGDDFCTDGKSEFCWTEEEVADVHDNATVLLAADVCYDDDLTDSLFRTLYRITSHLRHTSTVYISLEKRFNFTLRHLDVTCEAYDHFRHCMEELRTLGDNTVSYTVDPVDLHFPQFFQYERVEQLELWKVTASKPKN